jgi:hypothetical protein
MPDFMKPRGLLMSIHGLVRRKIMPDFMKPRGQLMSIHGFVRRDGKGQQFPLAFVVMSCRREGDYAQVVMKCKCFLIHCIFMSLVVLYSFTHHYFIRFLGGLLIYKLITISILTFRFCTPSLTNWREHHRWRELWWTMNSVKGSSSWVVCILIITGDMTGNLDLCLALMALAVKILLQATPIATRDFRLKKLKRITKLCSIAAHVW